MPPARRSSTTKSTARSTGRSTARSTGKSTARSAGGTTARATRSVRARAASTSAATRREVEQSITRFEKRLEDANDALSTLGKHLGRGATSSYKEVTAALRALRREAAKTNKQALKDFDKVRGAITKSNASSSRSSQRCGLDQRPLDRLACLGLGFDVITVDFVALHRVALDRVALAREEELAPHPSSVAPASIRIGSGASSSTAPRTTTPAPKVTSPRTRSRVASRSDGAPSGKRCSKSSSSL
jgi:hypothetical protein